MAGARKNKRKTLSLKKKGRVSAALFVAVVGVWALGEGEAKAAAPASGALPQSPTIVNGSAAVSASGGAMTVHQSTDKAVIHWQGFDIGSAASVSFQQPSSGAATLNRVTGGNPSQIMGKLSANGHVYIVNPNGVIFGEGAQVNVAGLVASSMEISDEDFEAGRHVYIRQGANGEIINEGTIETTEGGHVLLLGAKITNAGTIKAPNGKIVAAAGERVSVPLTQSGLVSIEIDPATIDASVTNQQGALIEATDGSVYLSAQAASDLAASVVNKGTVRADTVTAASPEGSVFLDSGSSVEGRKVNVSAGSITGAGTVKAVGQEAHIEISGNYVSLAGAVGTTDGSIYINGTTTVMLSALSKIRANGTTGGQVTIVSSAGYVLASGLIQANGTQHAGGLVEISGKTATTLLGATIEAKGAQGGGSIHVGGGWQGRTDLLRSNSVTVDTKTTLNADATTNGNGGEVVVWSQNTTSFYGTINARGGASGGNGGRVELSSAGTLNVQIASNHGLSFGARHASGTPGLLLLDPMNIVIGDAVASFDVFKALLTDAGELASKQNITSDIYFARAVALNDEYALIGVPSISSSRGTAYLYHLGTGVWTDLSTTVGQPISSLASSTNFGRYLALNNDYALIGAYGVLSSRGNAYLFNLSTGAWTDLSMTAGQPITALSTFVYFGRSVALNNNYALIGANGVSSSRGNAYLYNLTTGAWTDLSTTAGQPITGLAASAQFGYSAALNNNYALIGAYGVSSSRGNAYLYNLNTGAWTNLATTASQPVTGLAASSRFGAAVALNSDYALLGAYGVSSSRGNAYLYNLNTGVWTNLATTAGQPVTALAAGAYFGETVAINSNYAAIGAFGVSSQRGNVYFYNFGTSAWTDLATTTGQPITNLPAYSSFGASIALSSTKALIGATGYSSNRGNAYLYDLVTGDWTELFPLVSEPSVGVLYGRVFFASAVALSDNYALLGGYGTLSYRGNAYLYNLGTGAWTDLSTTAGQPITALAANSNFGLSVSLNDTYALISASGVSSGRGTAYLYNLGTGAWTDLSTTVGQPVTALASNASFGAFVRMNTNYALISASGVSSSRGNAYLYNLGTGAWTDLSTTAGQPITALATGSSFGYGLAITSNYALIGAYGVSSNRGNAYLYNLGTGAWTDLSTTAGQPITTLASNTNFARDVALNSNYALFGAYTVSNYRGTAYLYNLNTGAWTDLATTAGNPITKLSSSAYFGAFVALNSNYALIGASGVTSTRGNAYLYNLNTGTWIDLSTTAGSPVTALAPSSYFSSGIAINETYALMGANSLAGARGNAYLYNIGTGAWTYLLSTDALPIKNLTDSVNFGASVALNSNYALIGASGAFTSRGNAYLYNLASGVWTDLAATSGQPITSLSGSAYFGSAVALNNNYALIGAYGVGGSRGNAYLYNIGTGAWTDLSTTAGQPITALSSSSFFGRYLVALNDDYALMGAHAVSSYRGNAYLYNLGTGAWTDLSTTAGQPITALANSSYFGQYVALSSTYALIGAHGVSSSRGNAYLYNLGTGAWTDLATTAGQPITALAASSNFGSAVALSSGYALIGAYGISSQRGNAFLYNLGTGAWTDLAATAGQPITALSSSTYFGYTVAVNANYALMGTYGVSSQRGTAYLYNLGTGAWTDLSTTAGQPITALSANSNFGYAVALNNSYALIGAYGVSRYLGVAYLYDLGSGIWTTLTGGIKASAGTAVAITQDYALIGAPGYFSSRGNAYLYDLNSEMWIDFATTQSQPITALSANAMFGGAVALNDNYALIGASGVSGGQGSAFLYNIGTRAWTDLTTTAGQPVTALASGSSFGSALALNDNYALIGTSGVSSNRGNAYLYNLVSGSWTDLSTTTGQPVTALASGSSFGSALALNDNYALIGASGVSSNRGNAYLYNLVSGSWTDLSTTTGQPVTALASGSSFGGAVTLNDNYALIGASGVSSNRGNAYLYNLVSGSWTDISTTTGQLVTALAASSLFGGAVALNETYALIGASGVSSNRGNAYLYNLGTGAWTDLAALTLQPITTLSSNSYFGHAVALSDDNALMGAPGVGLYRGNAYLLMLEPSRVSSATIQTALASGNVVITADNRITIKSLNLSNANSGNSLTLQAGKDILIENDIDFGGRTTLLLANAPSSVLGDASTRLQGSGGITLVEGHSIENAGASLTLQVGTADESERTGATAQAGNLILSGDVQAGTLLINGSDSVIEATGSLVATGIGNALILNGREIGLTGGGALSASNGRWLVYNAESANLGAVALGGATAAFYRYGCTYSGGCTTGATIPAAGNGILYAYAPTLTISGMDSVTKVYDATTAIDTSSAILSGFANGDTAGLVASFGDKNVGTGKAISYSLDTALGYLLDGGAGTGSVTRASLSASGLVANNKVYDASTAADLDVDSAVLSGVIGSDAVTVLSGAGVFADKNAATGKEVTVTGVTLAGTDGDNYEVTGFPAGLTADITPKEISYETHETTITAGETTWGTETFTGVLGGDSISGQKMLVAGGGSLFSLDATTPAGDYLQRIVGLLGVDGANYVLASSGNIEGLLHVVSPPEPPHTNENLRPTINNVVSNIPVASNEAPANDNVRSEDGGVFGFLMQERQDIRKDDNLLVLYWSQPELGTSTRDLLLDIKRHVPDVVRITKAVSEEGKEIPANLLSQMYESGMWSGDSGGGGVLTVFVENSQGLSSAIKVYVVDALASHITFADPES